MAGSAPGMSSSGRELAMHIQKLFKPLEDLERNLSILYEKLSVHFAKDPDARVVFFRLHLEEKSHLALVQYQKRLVKQNPKKFGEIDLDLDDVVALAARVDELLWTKRFWSLREAVEVALAFERSAAEYHVRSALQRSAPDVASLIRNLGSGDHSHLAALKEFAVRRGFVDLVF